MAEKPRHRAKNGSQSCNVAAANQDRHFQQEDSATEKSGQQPEEEEKKVRKTRKASAERRRKLRESMHVDQEKLNKLIMQTQKKCEIVVKKNKYKSHCRQQKRLSEENCLKAAKSHRRISGKVQDDQDLNKGVLKRVIDPAVKINRAGPLSQRSFQS